MMISEKGLERARARAHAQTRSMLPDDEQRGAAIAAVEAACVATPQTRSAYGPAAAAVEVLRFESVIELGSIHDVQPLSSRIVRCYATISAGETLDQLRANATAGGAS